MRFVTLNGPIGRGKSWVVQNLMCKYTNVDWRPMSFQDVLAKSTQAMFGVPEMDYDTFKKTEFFGKTGRAWMIIQATEMRRYDEYFFARVLHLRMQNVSSKPLNGRRPMIFIADSNGFPDELDFFRVQEDVDLLACSIEPPEFRNKRGQLYGPDDSRFNLAHKCTVVQANSTLMLDALSAALDRRGWLQKAA